MRIPDTIDTVIGLVLFAVSAANGDRPLVFLGCALIFAVIYGARCWGLTQLAASYAAILGALRGDPPAAPVVTSRTLAHRNTPGHDGLTISVAVPELPPAPAVEATIALPAIALPAVSHVAPPDAAAITRQAVAALPGRVAWKLSEARLDAIPLIADGVNWATFNLYGNEDMVICGAKRKGKGNAIQLITLSALALGPDHVEVWYLDAKQGLDYSFAMDMQHARLYAEIRSAGGALLSDGTLSDGFDAAIVEMDHRNQAMYKKARNAREYAMRGGPRWPVIVLVVDEAAELNNEQKGKLNTIARMAGAAGFVLITCTQYPTADVLSSQVQANAVCRLCLQIPSGKYTPVALGLAPGEKSHYEPAAIGAPGIAVYRRNGDERLGRVPEVDDQSRDAVIRLIARQWPRVKVSSVSGGTNVPGPSLPGATPDVVPGDAPDTGAVLNGSRAVPLDADKMTKLRTLVALGISANAIVDALGGNRSDMLKIITLIKEGKL